MSNNMFKILALSFLIGITGCSEKKYQGEDMINYPDLKTLFAKEVDIEAPYLYTRVHQVGNVIDSTEVGSTDMPWDKITKIFSDASLQKEDLNFKYSIDIFNDTNARTMYYKALAPKTYTRSLSIVSAIFDNNVQSIYFETVDDGLLSTTYYRVLLVPDDLIQIQERKKSLFSEDKMVIDTYYFQN